MKQKQNNNKVWDSVILNIGDLLHGLNLNNPVKFTSSKEIAGGVTAYLDVSIDGRERWIEVKHIGKSGEILQEYEIYIVSTYSNLGFNRGKILYFICPVTGQRCRNLYFMEGASYFQHRTAYEKLYYPLQHLSKIDRVEYRLLYLNALAVELEKTTTREKYRGRKTRKKKRQESVKQQINEKEFDFAMNVQREHLQRIATIQRNSFDLM